MANRNKTKALLIALAASTMLAGSATAATIAEYAFQSSDLTSSDPSTNWETSDLSSGNANMLNIGGSGNPSPALDFEFSDFNDGTLQDSDYYQFTVTPDTGFELDLADFNFDLNKQGTADVSVHLYSDIDSYTSEIGSATVVGTGAGYRSWGSFTIDASGHPNLTEATTFRAYLFTTGSVGSNWTYVDNIRLTGNAIIPEPGSLALLGLGGLYLLQRRRRS